MTQREQRIPSLAIGQQRGAALVVGLVLMLVLTVLAISTMRTATLELAMAGNSQYRAKAEQLAEAGIADIMDRIQQNSALLQLNGAIDFIDTNDIQVFEQSSGDPVGSYRATISHIGISPVLGGGGDEFDDHNFEIVSTGRSQRNAQSTQTQGIKVRLQKEVTLD